jgi:hypothetical protein
VWALPGGGGHIGDERVKASLHVRHAGSLLCAQSSVSRI